MRNQSFLNLILLVSIGITPVYSFGQAAVPSEAAETLVERSQEQNAAVKQQAETAIQDAHDTAAALTAGTPSNWDVSTSPRGPAIDLFVSPQNPKETTAKVELPAPTAAPEAEDVCATPGIVYEPYWLCRMNAAVHYFNFILLDKNAMVPFENNVWIPALDSLPENVHLRKGLQNFFDNLDAPWRAVSNCLMFRFRECGDEFARFIINTTAGFLGFFDTARDSLGLQRHEADLGIMLRHWGFPETIWIELPFLPPMALPDLIGFAVKMWANPVGQFITIWTRIGIDASKRINERSQQPMDYDRGFRFIQKAITEYKRRLAKGHFSDWPPDKIPDFTGMWRIDEDNKSYTAILDKDGNGTHDHNHGTIRMLKRDGGRIEGYWAQKDDDRDGGFDLWLSEDGNSAEGIWWYTNVEGHHDIPPRMSGGGFNWTRIKSPVAEPQAAPQTPSLIEERRPD